MFLWRELVLHPSQKGGGSCRLRVRSWLMPRRSAVVVLTELHGVLQQLQIPSADAAAGFCDGLWQHTCFELFVAGRDECYREYNFSPSGAWAGYAFTAYRQRLQQTVCRPLFCFRRKNTNCLRLWVALRAEDLPPGADSACLSLGVSAVMEKKDRSIGYWALKHADSVRPDFHRREGFILTVDASAVDL